MTAPKQPGPQATAVKHALQAHLDRPAAPDMLQETELSARAQEAAKLLERGGLVWNGTENEAADGDVEAPRRQIELTGPSRSNAYAHRRSRCSLLSLRTKVGLWLDGHHLGHGRRVSGKVGAVASPKLQHPPVQTFDQTGAQRTEFPLRGAGEAIEEPGE